MNKITSITALVLLSTAYLSSNSVQAGIAEDLSSLAIEVNAAVTSDIVKGGGNDLGDTLSTATADAITGLVAEKITTYLMNNLMADLVATSRETDYIKATLLHKLKLQNFDEVGAKFSPSFLVDVVVNIAIDQLADITRDKFGAGTFKGEYAAFAVTQLKVGYAGAKGGVPAAIIAQTIIAGEQVSEVISLHNELRQLSKDNEIQESFNAATGAAQQYRESYKKASTPSEKLEIENQIRRVMDANLSYKASWLSFERDTPGKNQYINSFIESLRDADAQKSVVLQAIKSKIVVENTNADARRLQAYEFIGNNFSAEEAGALRVEINQVFDTVAAKNTRRIGYLYEKSKTVGGLSKLSSEEMNELMQLAIGIDSSLRKFGQIEILNRISVDLKNWESKFNVERQKVDKEADLVDGPSGVIINPTPPTNIADGNIGDISGGPSGVVITPMPPTNIAEGNKDDIVGGPSGVIIKPTPPASGRFFGFLSYFAENKNTYTPNVGTPYTQFNRFEDADQVINSQVPDGSATQYGENPGADGPLRFSNAWPNNKKSDDENEYTEFNSANDVTVTGTRYGPGVFVNLTGKPYDSHQYNHTAWGKWNGDILDTDIYSDRYGTNKIVRRGTRGYWVVGENTLSKTIADRTGEAEYKGAFIGDYVAAGSSVVQQGVAYGTVNYKMNFGDEKDDKETRNRLTGNASINLKLKDGTFVSDWFSPIAQGANNLGNGLISPNILEDNRWFNYGENSEENLTETEWKNKLTTAQKDMINAVGPVFILEKDGSNWSSETFGMFYGNTGSEVGGILDIEKREGPHAGEVNGIFRAVEQTP